MIELINAAWEVRGVSLAEKAVLVRLADRADNQGVCFPGLTSLADDLGVQQRTVSRAIVKLAERGHVSILREATATKSRKYRVHPTPPAPDAPPVPNAPPDTNAGGSCTKRTRGTALDAPGDLYQTHPNHHTTVIEPPRITTAGEGGELLALEPDQVKSKPDPKTSFDQFWKAWPKKDNKKEAFAVWKRINPPPEILAKILADVEKRTAAFDWKNTPHRFFPGPVPYLNGSRWEDQGVILPGTATSPMASGGRSTLERERAGIVCLLPVQRTRAQVARLAEIEAMLGTKEVQP